MEFECEKIAHSGDGDADQTDDPRCQDQPLVVIVRKRPQVEESLSLGGVLFRCQRAVFPQAVQLRNALAKPLDPLRIDRIPTACA